MSLLSRFQVIDSEEKGKAVRFLVEQSTPDFDFFFMMVLGVLVASLGLLMGSETIVIGSMLIAPLLYPVLGISLGISVADPALTRRSLSAILRAMVFTILAAIVATLFVASSGRTSAITPEILLRTSPSLLLLVVAVLSGLAVTYALVKPKLSSTLPGIAVSVALIPPLAVIGIGLAWLDFDIAFGAFTVFLLNVSGIIVVAIASFSLMNVHGERKAAHTTLVQEQRRVEKETAKVEKLDEKSHMPTAS